MLEIQSNDQVVQTLLSRIVAATQNTEPAMRAIGENLMEVSKQSFEKSASPAGVPWASNTQTTILRYLEQLGGGNYNKAGKLSKKGADRVMSKKPLIGISKDLMRQFSYVATPDSVTVSNSMVYAAMQQFGGTRSQFPNLWGDIPARPFMPLDSDGKPDDMAQQMVVETIQEYIEDVINSQN
ncbi:phage virion morphogenesis protein [Undibacterium sp. Di27W]|uniref:phage virion morphogenesis protein n=1 Tax=Undibacterium sp. Di27W TaxID=3413036 RepID=UPI003BF12D42